MREIRAGTINVYHIVSLYGWGLSLCLPSEGTTTPSCYYRLVLRLLELDVGSIARRPRWFF